MFNVLHSRLGKNQIRHLLKIASFSKDKSLKEENQAEMREQCLKLWKVRFEIFTISFYLFSST